MQKLLYLFAIIFVAAHVVDAQTPPTIPQAFSTNWEITIGPFANSQPLLAGYFGVNYPKNQAYMQNQDSGSTPYQLLTSTIGHPINSSYINGYQFLNEGRCWSIGELTVEDFHYFPLSIPSYATFAGNQTINGFEAGIWSWTWTELFPFNIIMGVRWTDGAVLVFEFDNSFFIPFLLLWHSTNWVSQPPPSSLFNIPPGPCPSPPVTSAFNSKSEASSPSSSSGSAFTKTAKEEKMKALKAMLEMAKEDATSSVYILTKAVAEMLESTPFAGYSRLLAPILEQLEPHHHIKHTILPLLQKESSSSSPAALISQSKKSSSSAPTPPVLHNYFSSNYEFGTGILSAKNNWQGNSFQVGYLVVDQSTGGAYISSHDNADQNVPYQFLINGISAPYSSTPMTNLTQEYMYLSPGRCWDLGNTTEFVTLPLKIPEDAVYNGTYAINKMLVQIWEFTSSSFYGYDAQVRMGVTPSQTGSGVAIVFINIGNANYPENDLFLKFTDFNPARPSKNAYATPPPPCVPFFPHNNPKK